MIQRTFVNGVALATLLLLASLPVLARVDAQKSLIGRKAYIFSMEDQYEKPHNWSDLSGRPVVKIFANRKASENVPNWTKALVAKLGDQVRYVAFADVRSVPFFLKGFIRGKFQEHYNNPILLDWEGTVFDYYQCVDDVPNLVFIDRNGVIRLRTSGRGSDDEIAAFVRNINQFLN